MKYIKTFKELGRGDAGIAGGKGASLGEMTNAGIPVPPGFVVLSDAFEYFIRETDIISEIEATLKKVNHKEMESVERASEVIRELIENVKMPKDLEREIADAYKTLDAEWVAVRSSATAEDGAEHAWAGQLDSFLNTKKTDLIKNVQRCFSSLFTPRAIFYRFEKGLHNAHISVAVVIQKMVQSEKSGIAFSVHPVTEDHNQMIIEGSWGLGEAIVSGQVTPDSYVVTKKPQEIIDTNIAEKTRGLFKSKNGSNEWEEIENKRANEQCLSGKEVIELADLIIKIENHYGFPCDIEWAYENKKFFIVQSRPITTLAQSDKSKVESPKKVIKSKKDKYHFHFKASTFPLVITELCWSGSKSYGQFEYLLFQEGDLMTGYCSDKGVKEQYDYGQKRYFNQKKMESLFKRIDELDAKMRKNSPKKEDYKDFKKREWIKFYKKAEDIFKNFGEIYYMMEPMVLASLAKEVEEICERHGLTQDKVLHDISIAKSFSAKEKKIVRLLADLGHKKFMLHEHVEPVLRGILEMFNFVSVSTDIHLNEIVMMKNADIHLFLRSGKINREILKERISGLVIFSGKKQKLEVLDGETYKQWKSEIEPEFEGEIKGTVAYRGKVKGKAVIHLSFIDTIEVEEGSVFVTGMTNPQMVPYIKHVGAIVTDEGGLTCHAAIIAREMKIPCIVGTKVATRAINDGDLVEVDANTGIVKILKRKG